MQREPCTCVNSQKVSHVKIPLPEPLLPRIKTNEAHPKYFLIPSLVERRAGVGVVIPKFLFSRTPLAPVLHPARSLHHYKYGCMSFLSQCASPFAMQTAPSIFTLLSTPARQSTVFNIYHMNLDRVPHSLRRYSSYIPARYQNIVNAKHTSSVTQCVLQILQPSIMVRETDTGFSLYRNRSPDPRQRISDLSNEPISTENLHLSYMDP